MAIKYVKLIATRSAPANIWRWEYEVNYESGSSRKYTDDTVPYSVEKWVSDQKAQGNMYQIREQVIGLVGWKPTKDK